MAITQEQKRRLDAIMKNLSVKTYSFDYTNRNAWVCFTYQGQNYHLECDISVLPQRGQRENSGEDALQRIIISLENFVRRSNKVCDLQSWIEGLETLPWTTPGQSSHQL